MLFMIQGTFEIIISNRLEDTLTNTRGSNATTPRFQSILYYSLCLFNLRQDPLVLVPVLMSYHEMEEYLNLVVKKVHPLKKTDFKTWILTNGILPAYTRDIGW